jgi:hypothetical protein
MPDPVPHGEALDPDTNMRRFDLEKDHDPGSGDQQRLDIRPW